MADNGYRGLLIIDEGLLTSITPNKIMLLLLFSPTEMDLE